MLIACSSGAAPATQVGRDATLANPPQPTRAATVTASNAKPYEVKVVDYNDRLPADPCPDAFNSFDCRSGWHAIGLGIEVTYRGGGPAVDLQNVPSDESGALLRKGETGVLGCARSFGSTM